MSDAQLGNQGPELTINGPVAILRLRRPAKMNRLTPVDLIELQRLCRAVDAQTDIRVLVLTADTAGQARPVFSAGYDIEGFDEKDHDPHLFEQTVDVVARLRPVVVAGLNGSVYGGATDMVLACDLRIGMPGLVWRMPACALGLHYYPSGLRRYVAAFGVDRTRQLFLTAQAVSSEQLQRWGVLMELVAADDWPTRLQVLGQQLAGLAPMAAQGTKATLSELARGHANDAVLRQREALCATSEDFREGRQALVERRTPLFIGC
jgi:enoyl-CoA hydratase/carnithine racemase